ncbi:Conserved_hypothetical protein [Hexamita inflata]|uniref:Uncharacterized protein n=1 Tax=Hexamita inflata TaxID=28002 RepID=A0AA86TZD1_9EUKA|nr:Conserved hypothetical protein [Hexamita inflata]
MDVQQEVNRIITTMSLQQLEKRAEELNNEQTTLNRELQNLIDTNLQRFKILQEPLSQIPDSIQQFSQQIQDQQDQTQQLHCSLLQTNQYINSFKKQAKEALQKKKELNAYSHYRSLAEDIRKQSDYNIVFTYIEQSKEVFDYIQKNGLNASLQQFNLQNNEALFELFTKLLAEYEKSFGDQYFEFLHRLGLSNSQVLRMTAELLNQKIPQLQAQELLDTLKKLCGQFKTKQIFMNKKCLDNILKKVESDFLARDDFASLSFQLLELMQLKDEYRENKSSSITFMISNQLEQYAERSCAAVDIQLREQELVEQLSRKTTEFINFKLKSFVKENLNGVMRDLNILLPFDARMNQLFTDVCITLADQNLLNTFIQKVNEFKQELQIKYKQMKPIEKNIDATLKESIQASILVLLDVPMSPMLKEMYAIVLTSRVAEIDVKGKITNIITEFLGSKPSTTRRAFSENAEKISFQVLVLMSIFQMKQITGSVRQVVVTKIRQYLKEENCDTLYQFLNQTHRKDVHAIRKYIRQLVGEPQEYNIYQFDVVEVNKIGSIRRVVYFGLSQALIQIFAEQEEFIRKNPLNKDDTSKVLVALIVLILTVSSVINESEMEALGYAMSKFLSSGKVEVIGIQMLEDLFDEVYMM